LIGQSGHTICVSPEAAQCFGRIAGGQLAGSFGVACGQPDANFISSRCSGETDPAEDDCQKNWDSTDGDAEH